MEPSWHVPERTGGAGDRVGFDTLSAGRQEGLASTVRSVPRVCSLSAAGGSKGLRRQRVDPPAETGAPGVREGGRPAERVRVQSVEP